MEVKVKCVKDIKKHNIHFKKGDMCIAQMRNDKMSVCTVDYNKGLTLDEKDFKIYFKNEE